MTAGRWLRRLGLLLAVGAVLFVFSERMFWSMWRPGDGWTAYLGGWLLYAFFGYVLLVVCSWFRVRDLPALFLAGACFGWLDEGVVSMTLFGDASLPFPLTVSWTGLAWHAALTVMLGVYGLRRCLQAQRAWPSLALSAGLGCFWGLWAAGWLAETPPIAASLPGFFGHAALATMALAAAELTWAPAGLAGFRPSRGGMAVAALAIGGFLALVTVPAMPYAPLILAPLFGVAALALHRGRRHGGPGPTMLATLGRPLRLRNLLGLAAIPLAATGTYAALGDVAAGLPIQMAVAAVTTLTGFGFLAAALGRALWPRGRALPAGARL